MSHVQANWLVGKIMVGVLGCKKEAFQPIIQAVQALIGEAVRRLEDEPGKRRNKEVKRGASMSRCLKKSGMKPFQDSV